MMKAVLFVLFLSGTPAEHFETPFDCNQAAIEASSHDLRAECRAYDTDGAEVVFKDGPVVNYIYPRDTTRRPDFIIEVR